MSGLRRRQYRSGASTSSLKRIVISSSSSSSDRSTSSRDGGSGHVSSESRARSPPRASLPPVSHRDSPPSSRHPSSSSSASTPSTSSSRSSGEAVLTPYERIVLLLVSYVYESWSYRQLRTCLTLSVTITASFALFSAKTVMNVLATILSTCNIRCTSYCGKCQTRLHSETERCSNRRCTRFNVAVLRSTSMRRKSVVVVGVVQQFKTVLNRNMDSILWIREDLSDANNDTCRKDNRFFPRFRDGMETPAHQAKGELHLQLSLSSDGFHPKRVSKRAFWPFYLVLDDLPPEDRFSARNVILAGMVAAPKSLEEADIRIIADHLKIELAKLERGVIVVKNNNRYRVKANLRNLLLDCEAVHTIFHVGHWNSNDGCVKCTQTMDSYVDVNRKNVRFWNMFTGAPKDTISYFQRGLGTLIAMCPTALTLVDRISSMMGIITPNNLRLDDLHLNCEGVTKDRCRDIVNARKCRVRALLLSQNDITCIDNSVKSSASYTYGTQLKMISDYRSMNGSELRMQYLFTFPILSFQNAFRDDELSVGLLCYSVLMRIMNRPLLTSADVTFICHGLSEMRLFWIYCFSRKAATLKAHLLLVHGSDEIRDCGSPIAWSTAPFESVHRVLQRKSDPSATNYSATRMSERHVALNEMEPIVAELGQRFPHDDATKDARSMLHGLKANRFTPEIVLNASSYIPSNSSPKAAVRNDLVARLPPTHRNHLRTRILIDPYILSSRLYHTQPKNSQSHVFSYRTNADCNVRFASLLVIGYDSTSDTALLVCEEYICHSPVPQLLQRLSQSREAHLKRLRSLCLGLMRKADSFGREVGRRIVVVDPSWYLAPATILPYKGENYCIDYR